MVKQTRLPQERWDTRRVKQSVPFVYTGIIDLMEKSNGWRNLANNYPGFAHSYAMVQDAPGLMQAFLDLYGNSKDLRFMQMSLDMRRRLRASGSTKNTTDYMGSNKPEPNNEVDLNWYEEQSLGQKMRALEEIE